MCEHPASFRVSKGFSQQGTHFLGLPPVLHSRSDQCFLSLNFTAYALFFSGRQIHTALATKTSNYPPPLQLISVECLWNGFQDIPWLPSSLKQKCVFQQNLGKYSKRRSWCGIEGLGSQLFYEALSETNKHRRWLMEVNIQTAQSITS